MDVVHKLVKPNGKPIKYGENATLKPNKTYGAKVVSVKTYTRGNFFKDEVLEITLEVQCFERTEKGQST